MTRDALLQRLQELEQENQTLRAQLRERGIRNQADIVRKEHEAHEHAVLVAAGHAQEMADANSHIGELKLSRNSPQTSEELLRASERRLRQIADNLPALISYVDSQQRYRFNNRPMKAG